MKQTMEYPTERFLSCSLTYNNIDDIMKSMHIHDEEIAEVISVHNKDDEEEIKQLIQKLSMNNKEIEKDCSLLTNSQIDTPSDKTIEN